MPDATPPEAVALLIEVVGLVMVSALLLPMTRAVPGQFLHYWAYAWTAHAVALLLELAASRVPGLFHTPLWVGYCLGEYLFGFLVWAGCREFATGEGFTARHAVLFLPLAVAAITLPLVLGSGKALAQPQGATMGGVFLFAFAATFRRGLRAAAPTVGLFAIRAALLGLAGLFLHSAAQSGATRAWLPDYGIDDASHVPLIRVLCVTTLAFGMAVLASERMREELEGKNRQLAAASAELVSAARTDALTGLFNRRAFDELTAGPGDPELTGCLAVLDLNDLKLLNDRHGHATGDAALRVVARALANLFRVTDPIYRTGGDEFVAVMAGGSVAELARRVGRLDAILGGVRLPGLSEPTSVTVSWGVAEFACCADLAAALQHADDLMYADKRARKAALNPPAPAPR